MSFMNPVDTVEEDAADLQFPKVNTQIKRKRYAVANYTESTIHNNAYDVCKLNDLSSKLSEENNAKKKSVGNYSTIDDYCLYCLKSLNSLIYFKCAECKEFLCQQCFANGRETKTHRNTHAYIIIRNDIQVFSGEGGWSVREEKILLNTLKKKGYGNWKAVAHALDCERSPEECRNHYHECYFGGIFERLLGLTKASQCYFPERMPYVTKMRSVDPPRYDDTSSMQFKIMAGYRPARGDFDTPYDLSAESLLTIIQQNYTFSLEQHYKKPLNELRWRRIDEELKCAMVRAYNHRLRERKRRYQIMRDHGLIMMNRIYSLLVKHSDTLNSEANWNRFLIFMQICNPVKFDILLESMKYFTEIRKSIMRLYDLRQNGIRTLADGRLYYHLKAQRLNDRREKLKDEKYRHLQEWRKMIPHYNPDSNLKSFYNNHINVGNQPRKKPGPMSVISLPGYSKLTESERSLCSVERIVPQAFLNYKNILICENIKLGTLRLSDARKLIKIDVNKTRRIYDFLIENGHINKPN